MEKHFDGIDIFFIVSISFYFITLFLFIGIFLFNYLDLLKQDQKNKKNKECFLVKRSYYENNISYIK